VGGDRGLESEHSVTSTNPKGGGGRRANLCRTCIVWAVKKVESLAGHEVGGSSSFCRAISQLRLGKRERANVNYR